jgi:arylsulfatase A-like enzyme
MDATATALDLARTGPEKTALDGVSLLPLLTGETVHFSERPLFWRVGKQNAMRLGEWKLIRSGKEWQLYNVMQDIGEGKNLAPQERTRVEQMAALWDQWSAEQIGPLWR